MLERIFRLSENRTTVRTELLAGLTTFLTMAYIIFLQPAVLSGQMFGLKTGMDFGAITTATCLSAALATAIMGLYARYPVAQAPGMGENFFFVLNLLPAASIAFAPQIAAGETTAWQIGLGVIFLSGVAFLLLSLLGVREALLEAVSPSMRDGIAAGIGLFIALIGLRNTRLIIDGPEGGMKFNAHFGSPDLIVFFFGLIVTGALAARRVRGAILWGIVAGTLLAAAMHSGIGRMSDSVAQSVAVKDSMLVRQFHLADRVVAAPPSIEPTLWKMDLKNALSRPMAPFVAIFLFMVVFDTLGTLIGVCQQAGFIQNDRLPRARQALMSDAVGTVAGAALGTSTVTSFIESASGVQQGGRTGLTACTVAALFLAALWFSPLIAMVGGYPPITAPALVVVGSMMMSGVGRIAWANPAEALPAFLIVVGIPLSYSIADGLALGFIAYPLVKTLAGQGREVKWLVYVLAAVLVAYFLWVHI